jgi:putative hemolysin
MKREREHFAVVLDEYGGMSGIITIKDLIQELVGDLEDEETTEDTPEDIIHLEENMWQVSGSILLSELSPVVGLSLECDEYDTLNGLIFHHLGTSPEVGSHVELENLHIEVTQIHNYQVERALVKCIIQDSQE